MTAKIIWLDQLFRNYGPEAKECRDLLRAAVHSAIRQIWPDANLHQSNHSIDPGLAWSRDLPQAIEKLKPANDAQTSFKSQACSAAAELGQMRWLLFEQSQTSVSTPLLMMMVFWMALIYGSICLFAPANGTVVSAQTLAAVAVAGALFLILELDHPFHGLVKISSQPMANALQHLAK